MKSGIAVLGSGSSGNALLVRSPETCILIDMGLPRVDLSRRLAILGLTTDDLAAIFATHTHMDHVGAAAIRLSRMQQIPLFSHPDNLAELRLRFNGTRALQSQGLLAPLPNRAFKFRDIRIESFFLPHDAAGVNLGYRVTVPARSGPVSITVATDLGHFPKSLIRWFATSRVIVLESNHDLQMLAESGRPQDLIDRISGPEGHLSNPDCAEALSAVLKKSRDGTISHIVLAHLSRDCNTAALAVAAARQALSNSPYDGIKLHASDQYRVGPVIPV